MATGRRPGTSRFMATCSSDSPATASRARREHACLLGGDRFGEARQHGPSVCGVPHGVDHELGHVGLTGVRRREAVGPCLGRPVDQALASQPIQDRQNSGVGPIGKLVGDLTSR